MLDEERDVSRWIAGFGGSAELESSDQGRNNLQLLKGVFQSTLRKRVFMS
jgi:hypothetical protein